MAITQPARSSRGQFGTGLIVVVKYEDEDDSKDRPRLGKRKQKVEEGVRMLAEGKAGCCLDVDDG
jgi:hypothetical protein